MRNDGQGKVFCLRRTAVPGDGSRQSDGLVTVIGECNFSVRNVYVTDRIGAPSDGCGAAGSGAGEFKISRHIILRAVFAFDDSPCQGSLIKRDGFIRRQRLDGQAERLCLRCSAAFADGSRQGDDYLVGVGL
ncbi:MAG: hypothetical protein BWX80_03114 [Candidatus Hydrogenedentes bacterium ADurb.Bin101]|nr:MAG: hypothetical protein BWX80_03114 [Candidatus Hydrogenedentes bacterium ADurb.Bin101]